MRMVGVHVLDSIAFQSVLARRLEAEQLKLELVLTWDAGLAGRGPAHWTTAPSPASVSVIFL